MDKDYVQKLKNDASQIRADFVEAWRVVEEGRITQDQAKRTLALLYRRSMLDILEYLPRYEPHYPAKQGYRGRLTKAKQLWWVDHATAGVNGWGTLGWFSNARRRHTKKFSSQKEAARYAKRRHGAITIPKSGQYCVTWQGYANAITHFVIMRDGTPFMLLPLEDGCWGEPKRNGDAIQVEVVNPLVVRRKGNNWYFWAGKLPHNVMHTQAPVTLDKPFRGARYMVPYFEEQVVTNIKLKRLCIAATGRMSPERMSQHTDWRKSKFDMGPLWPFEACNRASYETYPVRQYDFIQFYTKTDDRESLAVGDEIDVSIREAEDPACDHEVCDQDTSIDTTKETQKALIKLYGDCALPHYGADGCLGKETTLAVWHFQGDWNRNHAYDRLKEDGIPGVMTCAKLEIALLQTQFKTTPF